MVFMPEPGEVYPEPDTRTYNFDGLDKTMEGRFRPGHFNGVAQVVTRLFQIVKPQRAYFGLKDFQQQAILKKVVRDFNLPVELVVCPIIRESDGLAMSSRNLLLTPEQRKHAAVIHETLSMARQMSETHTPDEIRQFVTHRINLDKLLQTEYFEIADDTTLLPVKSWNEPGGKIGCIAVRVGKIRLIDNIVFSS
jgi:pantoate--beta-alanine ligase